MIFLHFAIYKQLNIRLLSFSKCRKMAVFAKNILYIFAAITNEIKYEKRQFKRRKRYENNVFHTCEK